MHGVDVLDSADHELSRAGPMMLLLISTVSDSVGGALLGVVMVVLAITEAKCAAAAVFADRVSACCAYVSGCDHLVILSLEFLLGVPHALAVLLHVARRPARVVSGA